MGKTPYTKPSDPWKEIWIRQNESNISATFNKVRFFVFYSSTDKQRDNRITGTEYVLGIVLGLVIPKNVHKIDTMFALVGVLSNKISFKCQNNNYWNFGKLLQNFYWRKLSHVQ